MRLLISIFGLFTLFVVSTTATEEQSTPFWDMIPVIAQGKSIVQLIFGDKEGAVKTQEHFLNEGVGSSQLRSLYFLVTGDGHKALDIQKKSFSNLEGILDGMPIVGHVKGGIHLLAGDHEHGWSALKSATSTTGTIVGGIFGGPAGAIGGHLLTDTLITGTDAVLNGNQSQPHGLVDYVLNINKLKPGEHFDVIASLFLDTKSGTKVKNKRNWFKIGGIGREESVDAHESQPLLEKKEIDTQRKVGMPKKLEIIPEETELEINEPDPSKTMSSNPKLVKYNDRNVLKSDWYNIHQNGHEKSADAHKFQSLPENKENNNRRKSGMPKKLETIPEEKELEIHNPGPSNTMSSILKLDNYDESNDSKFKAFKDFLQHDPTYKDFGLHKVWSGEAEGDTLIDINFEGLENFQYDSYLDELDIDSLKNKLSYMTDDEKSLINKNDFRTINTKFQTENCMSCSLAGLMKMNLETMESYIKENLESEDFDDTDSCLQTLKEKGLIKYTVSQRLTSLKQLNIYLKSFAWKLENKYLLLEEFMKKKDPTNFYSLEGHSSLLKYKMVKDNPEPVKLIIDFQQSGFVQPDIPNPYRFRQFIDTNIYKLYYLTEIEVLKQ